MLRGANGIVIIKGIYETCCQGAGLTQFSLGINLLKTGDESLHKTHFDSPSSLSEALSLGRKSSLGNIFFFFACVHMLFVHVCLFYGRECPLQESLAPHKR